MEDRGPYRANQIACSACGAPMREVGSRLVCDACTAAQVDPGELADAIGLREVTFADGAAPSKRTCPRCGEAMIACTVSVGGLRVDKKLARCERHGLWFDPDQLDDVMVEGIKLAREPGHRDRSVPSVLGRGPTGERGAGRLAPYVVQKWWEKPRPRIVVPYRSALAGETLTCPQCGTALGAKSDHWACETCGGLFVETKALEAMVTEMTRAPYQLPAVAGARGERKCPVCADKAVVAILDGIEIDRCPAHGIWFDAGELATLLAQAAGVEPIGQGKGGWLRGLFRGRAKPS